MARRWSCLRAVCLIVCLTGTTSIAAPAAADATDSSLDQYSHHDSEVDRRAVPWSVWRRLALLEGTFLPPYQPVTPREVAGLLGRDLARRPSPEVRLQGRVSLHELGPGGLVEGEAGLAGRGLVAVVEPDFRLTAGPTWFAVTPRFEVPLATGRSTAAALSYPGWPAPTGRAAVGAARQDPVTRIAWPRLAAGLNTGSWAVTAGLFPASVGVGLANGGLTLTSQARSMPQLVVRRTRPFVWSGLLGPVAPAHLLVRLGSTTRQTVNYDSPGGAATHRARPYFTQWLVTWNHTPWLRTTLTHAALSTARDSRSLWPDLLQINLPVLDATWREVDYGPVTDRIASLIVEARWRRAPWRWLPHAAGRVWWEYGGEDWRPHDVLRVVPEIAAPATLAGVELVDQRWDLAVEYLETRHPKVLWYSNSGFEHGYSHAGVVLGHSLGGAVEAWTGLLRWRSDNRNWQWTLRGRTATWEMAGYLPAAARRQELGVGWTDGRTILETNWVAERAAESSDRWLEAKLERRF